MRYSTADFRKLGHSRERLSGVHLSAQKNQSQLKMCVFITEYVDQQSTSLAHHTKRHRQ